MRLLAITLFTVIVSVVVAEGASAAGNHRMRVGISATSACSISNITGLPGISWHNDTFQPTPATPGAHDFHKRSSGGCTGGNVSAGAAVYLQSRHVSGNAIRFTVVTPDATSSCSRVRVEARDAVTNTYLGDLQMTHITKAISVGTTFTGAANLGWSFPFAGGVLATEASGCPHTGAHLHQAGKLGARLFRNSSLPVTITDPDNFSTSYVHLFSW